MASVIVKAGGKVLYLDPSQGSYDGLPQADYILITDIHGDHLAPAVIDKVKKPGSEIVGPKAVADKLPGTTVEEFCQFRAYSRVRVRVLLTLDTRSVDLSAPGVNRTDGDFALAWIRNYGKGRVFYSAFVVAQVGLMAVVDRFCVQSLADCAGGESGIEQWLARVDASECGSSGVCVQVLSTLARGQLRAEVTTVRAAAITPLPLSGADGPDIPPRRL